MKLPLDEVQAGIVAILETKRVKEDIPVLQHLCDQKDAILEALYHQIDIRAKELELYYHQNGSARIAIRISPVRPGFHPSAIPLNILQMPLGIKTPFEIAKQARILAIKAVFLEYRSPPPGPLPAYAT